MLQDKLTEVLFFLPSSVNESEQKLRNGNKFPMVTFGVGSIEGFENIYKAVNIALSAGYRSFECEPSRNQEDSLGIILEDVLPKFHLKRKDIFLTGKISPKNYGKNSTKDAFMRTCCNLKTSYLDMFLMLWPGTYDQVDENENLRLREETWKELMKLNRSGAIKNLGVCNFEVKHLEFFKEKELILPVVNQVEFHPKFPQRELSLYCKENSILLQATGFKNTFHPLVLNDNVPKQIGRKLNKTPAQILLKWILNKGVAVIVQSHKPNVIRKNFMLYDFVLEKPEMDAINSISVREKYLMNPIAAQ